MNLGAFVPDAALTAYGWLVFLPLLLASVVFAPWRQLANRPERRHAMGAAIVILPLLWSMNPALPGAGVHLQLFGMTAVALVFGWQLAVIIGAVSGAVLLLVGTWSVQALPVNLVLTVMVPVAVSWAVLWLANRLRRTNVFVYMLGVGFFGSMLAFSASLALANWLFALQLDHPLVFLLTFPEGWLNGAIVSALTIFHPEIVRTYDDVRYLGKPR